MIKKNSNIQDVLYRKELIDAVNENIRNISLVLLALFLVFLCASFPAFAGFAPAGAILLGLALVCGGLGVLCGIFTGYLCYWTGLLMKKIFTAGRRKKGAEAK